MTFDDKENRLEQALREWEDLEFTRNCFRSLATVMREEPEFRTFLIEHPNPALPLERIASVRGELLRAVTSVPGDGALVKESFPETSPFRTEELLWGLHGWSRCSRRMYRVPGDLQLLLEATTLTNLWTDIKLPFDAYAVLLEEPVELGDGGPCDVALLYRHGDREVPSYQVTLFPQSLSSHRPLDSFTREHMLRAVRQRDAKKLHRLGMPLLEQPPSYARSFGINAVPLDEVPPGASIIEGRAGLILQGVENELVAQGHGELGRGFLNALRITLGLGLYLSTFPPGTPRPHSPWAVVPVHKKSLRVVTDRAQVCRVQSTRTLTPEDRSVFHRYRNKRGGGYEIGPHPRSGYWSRPRGKGSDPSAEKTVWHEPTIVRRDLVLEGTLPYGSLVRLPRRREK